LIPGAYRFLAVPGSTFAFFLASVLLGGREVLGQVVELTAAAPALRVMYNANPSSVHGTVEKGECTVILLLPNPPVPPLGGRTQPCKAGEAFEFVGVPPGEYYALAFERADPSAPPHPAYLMNLLPYATRVSVAQGPSAPIQLSITALPQ
jgi:hypothetical protein